MLNLILRRVWKWTYGRWLNLSMISQAWAILRIIGLCYYNSSCDRAGEGYLDSVATLLNRRQPGAHPQCWGQVASTDRSMLHSSCPCDLSHPMWCLCGPMENASFHVAFSQFKMSEVMYNLCCSLPEWWLCNMKLHMCMACLSVLNLMG